MAARSHPHSDSRPDEVIELRQIAAEDLSPVLDEEIEAWRTELNWDFRPSAELVRRFVQMQALNGFALARSGRVVGYSYYVSDNKGLIGDFYVQPRHRTVENENALLECLLNAMWRSPGIRRIEAQLMMLSSPLDHPVPFENCLYRYPRLFLEAPLSHAARLPPRDPAKASIGPWSEMRQEETARLIANSYQGHVDSLINDQYRSTGGARRFLMNIVQYPGCGTFFGPASYAAADISDRLLCGVSLASLVAPEVGHITQVCVSPSHRGTGLGYELVRRSLVALAAHGCRSVSLTVTASNQTAIRLYEQMGFTNRRDFAAYVWEPR
jgi:ribosomal protein S18 acetylase RimI-like enzyme